MEEVTMNPARRETEVATREECVAVRGTQRIKDKSLILLQVNCRSIFNKALDFRTLVDTYNPDAVIGTETWLREDISNAEILGLITQLSEEIGVLEVVESSFA
jgi:hypothetical protein